MTRRRAVGYVFNYDGRSYTPDGAVPAMTREQTDAHNAALGRAEAAWIRSRLPDRCIGYLHKDADGARSIRTWGGHTFTVHVHAATGRRWNPFGVRWDTVVRGHAHVRATHGGLACYTFSGNYGMLTRLRRVKWCRVARVWLAEYWRVRSALGSAT